MILGACAAVAQPGSASPASPSDVPRADRHNGQVFIQDNLWRGRHAVWVNRQGTPLVGTRRDGRWRVFDLAQVRGNPLAAPTAADGHNVYAIGVDRRGGIHIAGNMHGEPLRYVRRLDGHWRRSPAPRFGHSVSYPAFTGLPDGTLLFWRREGVAGGGAIVLDALAPGARAWRTRGVVLDGDRGGESPYLHRVAVDHRTGVIHLLYEWRGTPHAATTNDVGYAASDDGGRSWRRSDGRRLPAPITHRTAETIIDTPAVGSGLINQGGLAVDAAGMPHGVVLHDRGRAGRWFEHIWHDAGGWRSERLDAAGGGRAQVVGMRDGRVWLLTVVADVLQARDVTPGRRRLATLGIARVPRRWEPNIDSQTLARHGRVKMLIPDASRPRVVVAKLPSG